MKQTPLLRMLAGYALGKHVVGRVEDSDRSVVLTFQLVILYIGERDLMIACGSSIRPMRKFRDIYVCTIIHKIKNV